MHACRSTLEDPTDVVVATLVISLVLTAVFHEIIFSGKTLLTTNVQGVMGTYEPYGYPGTVPTDNYRIDPYAGAWFSEPITHKTGESLLGLQVPLWNANMGTGMPLLADIQSSPFALLKLPAALTHSALVWDIYLLGRFLLAGLVTYLYGKRMGLSPPAALTAAIAFILSGYFFLFSNFWYLDIFFSMPLLLLCVEGVLRSPDLKSVLLLGLAVAFNLFSGMPEPSFLTILLAGAYAVFRAILLHLEKRRPRGTVLLLAALGGGFAVGFALAMPMLLPFVEYSQNSINYHMAELRRGLDSDQARKAISVLVPYVRGLPFDRTSAPYTYSGDRGYVGLVVPVFACLGLLHPRLRKEACFFIAVALLLFLKSYGLSVVNDVGKLPLFNQVLYAQWAPPVVGFCVAIAAGIGVDVFSKSGRLGWRLHAAVVAVLLLLAGLAWLSRDLFDDLPQRSLVWLEFGLGSVAVTWLVLWVLDDSYARLRGWACVALVAVGMVVLAPQGIYRDRYDTFTKPPYVDFLEARMAQEGRSRVFGWFVLTPNDASAYNLDDIRSIEAISPERYLPYVRQFIQDRISDRFMGNPLGSSEGISQVHGNRMFDLLGVRYVVTNGSGLPNPLTWDLVALYSSPPSVYPRAFTIDGQERPVLLARVPTDLKDDFVVTPALSYLRFSPTLDPAVWDTAPGGVTFRVSVEVPGGPQTVLYERTIDPRVPSDRHWQDEVVDLSRYNGSKVSLHLQAQPSAGAAPEFAGWGDIRLTGPKDPGGASQYTKVYDKEVQIYRNNAAMGRAFAMSQVEELSSGADVLKRMHEAGFEPAKTALVEKKLPDSARQLLTAAPSAAQSNVTVTSYEDQKVRLHADMAQPGMVVLSDTYYPGWVAEVDGKRTPIYQTDYLFRGVLVPQGSHTVVFKYSPRSFKNGLGLAAVALMSLGAWWGYEVYRGRRAPLPPADD